MLSSGTGQLMAFIGVLGVIFGGVAAVFFLTSRGKRGSADHDNYEKNHTCRLILFREMNHGSVVHCGDMDLEIVDGRALVKCEHSSVKFNSYRADFFCYGGRTICHQPTE